MKLALVSIIAALCLYGGFSVVEAVCNAQAKAAARHAIAEAKC